MKNITELCITTYVEIMWSMRTEVVCTYMNDVFDQHMEYTITACDHIIECVVLMLHHRH